MIFSGFSSSSTQIESRRHTVSTVAKEDLVIKAGKRIDPWMHRPEVAMTFFMSCEDPMEEEAENMASSSLAPLPLLDEEMVMRI